MMENEQNDSWKQKAILRRLELKELEKRKKEIHVSREHWKGKYMEQKARADYLESELQGIKKKLTEIISQ